jgi:hypothetical protein
VRMSHTLLSSFAIGQRVYLKLQGARVDGIVRAITFTSSKVRYAVRVDADETTLHNIDSSFVFSEPDAEIVNMPEDNYS